MDADRFDDLARRLGEIDTRRRLLRRLAVLPAVGTLVALVSTPEDIAAEQPDRRVQQEGKNNRRRARRRRRRHKRKKNGGGERCVPLDQICSLLPFATPCCEPTQCLGNAQFGLTTCQLACSSDAECQQKLNYQDVVCEGGPACFGGGPCCRPAVCSTSAQCAGGTCCPTLLPVSRCCAPGQHCAEFGGCATD